MPNTTQPPVKQNAEAPAKFPSLGLAWVIGLYEILWHILMPLVLLYFWNKGKREPLYRQFMGERWGRVHTQLERPLWVHSASMGEVRGAAPLVRALIEEGTPVLWTTLTAAGRSTIQTLFAQAITEQKLQAAYVPFELGWAIRSMIRRTRPQAAMMTEIDTWPVLLATIRRQGIPLCIANAQYPKKSYERDQKWGGFRAKLFQAYQLVLCKSPTHAERFTAVGCSQVAVVGETRFELPIPPAHLQAAAQVHQDYQLSQRPVICFASAIEGEDEQFLQAITQIQNQLSTQKQAAPLIVYVPRSPQRFDWVANLFTQAGQRVARRSQQFDTTLSAKPTCDLANTDILIGDSLGEMYFYLALSQVVVVGASFVPLGAHNVIEPLALKKPVMVGPSIWGIEYPGVEAIAAGVLQSLPDINALTQALLECLSSPQAYAHAQSQAEQFFKEHAGSTQKHLNTLRPWLAQHA